MQIFFIFSLVCCIILLACIIIATLLHAVVPPQSEQTASHSILPAFLYTLPFFHSNFIATMISTGILALYVPATMFLLLRFFENTQSSELIFFTGMLLGVFCESSRLLVPLFGLGLSFSNLLLLAGRILVFGRLVTPLCFLCAAIFSEASQRQDVERNVIIVMAISAALAASIPLNTAQITTTCAIPTGFSFIFMLVRFLIFVLTIVSFAVNAKNHDSLELKQMTRYAAILIAGYFFLIISDTIVFLSIGTAALAIGTIHFLRNLHRLYKWK